MATTLGNFTWNLGSGLSARKIGLNSESANAFESIKRAILNENGEFYIISNGTNFNTEVGEGEDVFNSSETKGIYTSGASQNTLELEFKETGGIVNDVVIFGKGIGGEDVISRAVHATKFRTKIQDGNQLDYTLSATITEDAATMTLSQDLPAGVWAAGSSDRPYVIIGHEMIKINAAVYLGITAGDPIAILRGQGGTGMTTLATQHVDYSEVIFLGELDDYTTVPTPDEAKIHNATFLRTKAMRTNAGFYTYFTLECDEVHADWPESSGAGSLYIGDEIFSFTALSTGSDNFDIRRRGVLLSDVYQHPQGSPVTCSDYSVDSPEALSSIAVNGQVADKFPLEGLWSRGTGDIRAESILQIKALAPEEITINIADCIEFYMDSSGSTFDYNLLAGGSTKNLNIIGHILGINDDASNLSGEDYKCVQEQFFFNQGSEYQLKLVCRNVVDNAYSASSGGDLVNTQQVPGMDFVEALKKSIKTEVAETARTTDYNKKLYTSSDKSGGMTFVPGLNIADAYTLPTVDGSANEVMVTDGSGILSWAAATTLGLWVDDLTYLTPTTSGRGIKLYDGGVPSGYIVHDGGGFKVVSLSGAAELISDAGNVNLTAAAVVDIDSGTYIDIDAGSYIDIDSTTYMSLGSGDFFTLTASGAIAFNSGGSITNKLGGITSIISFAVDDSASFSILEILADKTIYWNPLISRITFQSDLTGSAYFLIRNESTIEILKVGAAGDITLNNGENTYKMPITRPTSGQSIVGDGSEQLIWGLPTADTEWEHDVAGYLNPITDGDGITLYDTTQAFSGNIEIVETTGIWYFLTTTSLIKFRSFSYFDIFLGDDAGANDFRIYDGNDVLKVSINSNGLMSFTPANPDTYFFHFHYSGGSTLDFLYDGDFIWDLSTAGTGASASDFKIRLGDTAGGSIFKLHDYSDVVQFFVDSNGHLWAQGTGTFENDLTLDDGVGASPTLRFISEDNVQGQISKAQGGSFKFNSGTGVILNAATANDIVFSVNNVTWMQLDTSDSRWECAHFFPISNNTYNLGDTSFRWASLWVGAITATTVATSSTITSGGLLTAASLTVTGVSTLQGNVTADNMHPTDDSTYSLGTADIRWLNMYADNMYCANANTDQWITGATIEKNLLPKEAIEVLNKDANGLDTGFREGEVLVWKNGMTQVSTRVGDMVVGVASKDGLPIILGVEKVKVSGKVKVGDLLIAGEDGCAVVRFGPDVIGTVIAQAMESNEGGITLIKAYIQKM